MKNNLSVFVMAAILFHLVLLISLKFTAWPEMTLWPYLITKGWLPYRDIAIAHTPLMLGFLSIIYKIFGTGILQLRMFTWVVVLGLDILIFVIAKRLWNVKTAFFAVCAFIFWQLFFDGNGLWFDLFMGVAALISYFFIQKKNYFWAGIFWALAFISKQTAVWFLIPIGVSLIMDYKQSLAKSRPLKGDPCKVIANFVLGTVTVLVVSTLVLWLLGILPTFWNWAIKFGVFILPGAQGQVQPPDMKNFVVAVFPFLVFIPLIFKTGKKNIALLIWAIAGCLGAYPRFEYFHLQPGIPFLAIGIAKFITDAKKSDKLIKLFIPFYVLGSVYLFGGFFMRNFKEGVRFYENDVQDVVSYVRANTSAGGRIFVMNWWDNIYALSDRIPATDPWVPQLSWYTEVPGIQEKMVEGLMNSKPKLIILNSYSDSGLSAYIPQTVYNYVTANYKLKEKIDNLEILIPKN